MIGMLKVNPQERWTMKMVSVSSFSGKCPYVLFDTFFSGIAWGFQIQEHGFYKTNLKTVSVNICPPNGVILTPSSLKESSHS